MKKMLLVTFSLMLIVNILHAQKPEVITNKKPGWHKIGDANVDFKSDKDKFIILGADRFKALQVKVTDAPVHMESMQIEYEGGQKEDVPLRENYKTGMKSRVINLKNNSAELKNVTFVYHTVPNSKNTKAHIELWGLK